MFVLMIVLMILKIDLILDLTPLLIVSYKNQVIGYFFNKKTNK